MSDIDPERIDHIAKLANLALDENERNVLAQDMAMILEMVEKINKVDVSGVEVLSSVNGLTNISRKDEIVEGLNREAVLERAPLANAGYVKVPKVLD